MLAVATSTPALELDEAEAVKLQDAIKRVWKHYPVNVSQKQLDIAFACTVAAEIYGTRVAAAVISRRKPRKDNEAPANLFQFPNAG